MKKGFTLLEAILAIFVTLVGVLGAYGLSQQILSYSSLSNSKFTAAYLAKEGIEIVRNIRDTNWVEEDVGGWDSGLSSGQWEADYSASSLSLWTDPGTFLRLETGTDLYGYGAGSPTKYKRRITISGGGVNPLEVSVTVNWLEKGNPQEITAEEILYEWWQ